MIINMTEITIKDLKCLENILQEASNAINFASIKITSSPPTSPREHEKEPHIRVPKDDKSSKSKGG